MFKVGDILVNKTDPNLEVEIIEYAGHGNLFYLKLIKPYKQFNIGFEYTGEISNTFWNYKKQRKHHFPEWL